MGKEETLRKLSQAQSQIRAIKEAAERERERALRDARREALELRDRLRGDADVRHREIVSAAESSLKAERERILSAGRGEADKTRARGMANLDAAVRLVLEAFKGARHA